MNTTDLRVISQIITVVCACCQTFPKPWTVAAFITMLVRVLRIADFEHKSDIIDAITLLYSQEGIPNPEPIYKVYFEKLIFWLSIFKSSRVWCVWSCHEVLVKQLIVYVPLLQVLYSVLNHHTHPPTCVSPVEKTFIFKSIELLSLLDCHDRQFFIELMAQFLDGDKDIRFVCI